MSEYEVKVDKVRNYFKEHRDEKYPIENSLLQEKDEYTKSLYLRMLCTLVRYTGEATEMQTLYIRRLIAGIGAENKLEDYMRMALDINTEDIGSFISLYAEDVLRYYFCIDGMILLAAGSGMEKNYELLSEIVEALGLRPAELKHLTHVSKAILEQSSQIYEEAKSFAVESTKGISFYSYLKDFYVGAIIDTSDEKHYYSNNKAPFSLDAHGFEFKEKKIVFERLELTISSDWNFTGCQEVEFIDCLILGEKNLFNFKAVGSVTFKKCRIEGFTQHVAGLNGVNCVHVIDSHIVNCGCIYDGYQSGGVFFLLSDMDLMQLKGNVWLNCYIKTSIQEYFTQYQGVLIGGPHYNTITQIVALNNQFAGCQIIKNNKDVNGLLIDACSVDLCTDENNEYSGKIRQLIKKE